MILYLHGKDSYRLRQRLHYYRDGFKKKYDPSGLNVAMADGTKLTAEQFRTLVGQTGFIAQKRFIVIEGILKNKQKKELELIAEYLAKEWPDVNVLIFVEAETAERRKKGAGRGTTANPLLRYLAKETKEEEFPELTGEQLLRWVRETVATRGGTIGSDAARELVRLVGADLWSMASEIDKLVSYRGKSTIGVADVLLLVRGAFDENIFHLTDALAAKNAKRALQLLHDQFSAGAHELYLLTMLTRQFRILLQAQAIAGSEPNSYTIASRLGIHPFVAQQAVRDSQRFTAEELQDIFHQLVEIDVAIKTSAADPRLLFDLLVMRVCGVR